MKKYTLLMLAGGMFAFAACNTNNATDSAAQKAREDSIVNARTAEMEAKMKRNNDSLINAAAAAKADSMVGAMKGAAQQTGNVAAKPAEKKVEHTKPATIGNGKPAMGNSSTTNTSKSNSNTIGNGKPKMGDK